MSPYDLRLQKIPFDSKELLYKSKHTLLSSNNHFNIKVCLSVRASVCFASEPQISAKLLNLKKILRLLKDDKICDL